MPTYSIQGPDGKTYSIDGPEGATRDQVISKIKERMGSSPPVAETAQPAPQKPKNQVASGPFSPVVNALNDSGVVKGAITGAEELPYGLAQTGMSLARSVGLKVPPGAREYAADQVKKIEAQDKGTGVGGAVGEMLPYTLLPGGEEAKGAETLGNVIKKGMTQGAKTGATFGAIAPTTDPKKTLLDRGGDAAMGAVGGGVLGAGTAGAGAAAQKALGKAGSTPVADAIKFFGMDFSKTKNDQDIASEMSRAVKDYNNKIGSMISDREATPPSKTSQVSQIGQNMLNLFKQRKANESTAWNTAEPVANGIARDLSEPIEQLKSMAKELQEQVKAGTATEKSKADLNLINGTIRNMGGVVETGEPETSSTIVKEVGGKTRTVTRTNPEAKPFAADAEKEETFTPEATVSRRDGKFAGSVESEPINRTTSVADRVKTTEQSPYTVTTKRIKPGKEVPEARKGSVGDLVRGMKYINSEDGAAASSKTRNAVRRIVNDQLADVSKENPQFQKLHKKAIDWTQRNADIYRDEGKLSKNGFKEQDLWDMHNKLTNGRMLSLEDTQKLNDITSKVKTPEDLLLYRRTMQRQPYNLLMRARWNTLTSDINMNVDKFKEYRPLMEEILKQSNVPKAKATQLLDSYETVAEKMTDAGLDASGKVNDVSTLQNRLKELNKAVLFGGALGNPKQAIFHTVQAAAPSPNPQQIRLRNFKNLANPSQYSGAIGPAAGNISGAAIGAALRGNQ